MSKKIEVADLYIGKIKNIINIPSSYDEDNEIIEPEHTLLEIDIKDEQKNLEYQVSLKYHSTIFGITKGIDIAFLVDDKKENLLEIITTDNVSKILPRSKKFSALLLLLKSFLSLCFWVLFGITIYSLVDADGFYDMIPNLYNSYYYFFVFADTHTVLYFSILYLVIYAIYLNMFKHKIFYFIRNISTKDAFWWTFKRL